MELHAGGALMVGGAAALLASRLPAAGEVAGGLALAAVAVAALALLFRRRPDVFPLVAIFALPFRLPISAAGRTVNLLVPLYLVVAAGTIALLLPEFMRRIRSGRDAEEAIAAVAGDAPPTVAEEAPSAAAEEAIAARGGARGMRASLRERWLSPRGVEWLLLAAVALYALQTLYSADRGKAAENIAFFYIPFGLLFALLRRVRWDRELLLRCLGVAVALGVVFAGIGFVEYHRKALFLNPKVVAANQYDNYFRVNSLFFDPNIYGRFLAIVMIAVSTVVLWSRRRRDIAIGAAVLAWLLGGLITSFSQSSIAALLLGLALLAGWRWSWRATLAASAGLLALGGALVLLAPASLHFGLKGSSGSTSNATSGRTKLISGGLELFAQRPLAGYGAGSFETEFKRHRRTNSENATSASHTIPVTVAAEQGLVGLAVYAALLVAAFAVLFTGAGRSPPRVALAACFAGLVLHTWTYADFLEDPFTWALLAIGLALAAQAAAGGAEGAPAQRSEVLVRR